MPGILPHLIAGLVMTAVAGFYYNKYLNEKDALKRKSLMIGVCLFFSMSPDVFLGLYYIFAVSPYSTLLSFHILLHLISIPIAASILILLKYCVDVPEEPLWVMAFSCIIIHIIMDVFIPEIGILI